ncbi:hypothetical protein QFZ64_006702 [Streptomyces sp. B3I8]|nr:hypothetical protein [Streptomyces sp. B3I8]
MTPREARPRHPPHPYDPSLPGGTPRAARTTPNEARFAGACNGEES